VSTGAVRGTPAADGFAGDPEEFGELGFGVAQCVTVDRTESEGIEDVVGELAGIGKGNGHGHPPRGLLVF
jgi:hypothetical protein